jgi:hypothetical protein
MPHKGGAPARRAAAAGPWLGRGRPCWSQTLATAWARAARQFTAFSNETGLTLETLQKAADAVGCRLEIHVKPVVDTGIVSGGKRKILKQLLLRTRLKSSNALVAHRPSRAALDLSLFGTEKSPKVKRTVKRERAKRV